MQFESNDVRNGWDGYYKGQLSRQDVYASHDAGTLSSIYRVMELMGEDYPFR
ncbi:MAG: hypothetical protein IPG74_15520 [Flavobacteriales bacterium]|nr:hypothetical protein [Flavobacteriales bacterium]